MRRILPLALLATISLFTTSELKSQNDRFAYAITDLTKEGSSWSALRKLDLQTGTYSDVILNGADLRTEIFDAGSKKHINLQNDPKFGNLLQAPFSTGVAAAAFDKRHNRLYFTPMFIDQLRYIDLNSMKVFYVSDQAFTKIGHMKNDEGKVITRMAIAADGYGYAITNDGSLFIRFSTSKKAKIEQLGSLVDDPQNKNISIHNKCSSFGGDMISDDLGNLYIISAFNNVFKVNIENKIATHLGTIKNLPAGFTTNGAVVDADNKLLVSSAMASNAYYTVDPKDWTAKPFLLASTVYKSSDLANSNILCTGYSPRDIVSKPLVEPMYPSVITLYPNPVTSNRLTVQFTKVPSGEYNVELTDMLGKTVIVNRININAESQTQELSIYQAKAKGFYMVRIYNLAKQAVFTQKLLVQAP
ncbi:MAG: T9SS type A sorting domain-containing protein [Flavisolibacter sp.]